MLNILRSWIDRYFGEEETVLLALLLVVSFVVILTMGAILAPVIAAVIIAFLMQGLVGRLQEWGVPHIVAVVLATLVLLGVLAASFLLMLPALWQQSVNLLSELPRMLTEWKELLLLLPEKYPALIKEEQIDSLITAAGSELGGLGQVVVSFSLANLPVLFGVLIYAVIVPILVFFFLKDSDTILSWIGSFLPHDRPTMQTIWTEMNLQVANYVRGKVIEILVVGAVSFVAFIWLGLNYALLLALAVGLSVVIPYIGAVVVTLPVALIGMFQWGLGTEFMYLMIVYLIIQTLDGNVLVPLLFSEAVNLHPVAIIMAVLVFGGLWGLWGVFFAIPLATLIKAILSAWPTSEEQLESA
ncbi:AI-2E family transporter [Maricurvus nonylphenolicus]|uniref:AI-2E family transporter n=1 Tax=Maricurvus nonylphenolicus TaxID=1008307 RepID=UPI0036F2E82F